MPFILVPISLFIKGFTNLSYMPFITQYQIYVYLILILIAGLELKKQDFSISNQMKGLFSKKVVAWVLIGLSFQMIAMTISHYSAANSIMNRDPIREIIKFIIIITCIFIHYVALKVIITTKDDIKKFIQGSGIALAILLLVTYIQFFYLLFPHLFSVPVKIIGALFEQRAERQWYLNGSYVETTHRINGFSPESGFLAAQLLIIFCPLLLSAIKNKSNIFFEECKYYALPYYLLLFSIMVILFFAKTTTGLLAILVVIFSLWMNLSRKKKLISGLMLPVFIIVVYVLTFISPLVRDTINFSIWEKFGGISSQNRLGSTIALFITWITHPIWGVGWNFNDYYVFKYIPQWTTSNYEFQKIFLPQHFYPIMSIFFGWLAVFGTILVTVLIVYVHRLLRDFRKICDEMRTKSDSKDYHNTLILKDAAHYFIYFYFIIALFSFNWTESMYFVMFFFFVVVRQILKKNRIFERPKK